MTICFWAVLTALLIGVGVAAVLFWMSADRADERRRRQTGRWR